MKESIRIIQHNNGKKKKNTFLKIDAESTFVVSVIYAIGIFLLAY